MRVSRVSLTRAELRPVCSECCVVVLPLTFSGTEYMSNTSITGVAHSAFG